ncbi:MAG: hypothetical protein FWE44_00335 [Defluviitaleaceae bacterium]|nr:hypothetical protein [Defluviitaleaceae bacterium]
MPKILITAGGTIEKIDAVRSIINDSTGQLGAEIAKVFTLAGCEVFYIKGKNALMPNCGNIVEIESAKDLDVALENILMKQKIDAVIHAMAVSDYGVKNADITAKISSDADEIALVLKKIPKTIAKLRRLAPNAVIVGFKLTSSLTQEETINKAHGLLLKNDCDFVLANDTVNLTQTGHVGYLVDKNKKFQIFTGKEKIAQAITNEVMKCLI